MTPQEQQIIAALLGPGPQMPAPRPQGRPPVSGFGADRSFAPGPGVRVAQNMTPQEMRATWDESVADDYDKNAGDLALEWMVEGKNADVAKSLDQLREAQINLQSGADNLSGPLVGSWLGQQLAPMVNPESVVTKEAIEEVVQRNLRLVLGAQFTEKEGERLISRAFNPKLQEPENAKRVGRLLQSIQDAAASREAAAQYFMQNGTLVGWDGRIQRISDIEAAMDAPDQGGEAGVGAQPDADGWVTLPNGRQVRRKE